MGFGKVPRRCDWSRVYEMGDLHYLADDCFRSYDFPECEGELW